jgi:hypothetical protein
MEEPFVLPAHKLRASQMLLQGGKQSLGILIERLALSADPVFLEQTLVPTGPLNPGPPRKMCVTLKFQIEYLLYEILYPQQSPRPELLGERTGPQGTSSTATQALPTQSLAQMKADWDSARDTAIGELAPAELGGCYAFISDWQAFWKIHGHKDLDSLRQWSRTQVEAIWSGHLGGLTQGRHSGVRTTVALQSVARTSTIDIEPLRNAYERAWSLYQGAATVQERKLIAFKGLDELEKKHPSLTPHLGYLRMLLT